MLQIKTMEPLKSDVLIVGAGLSGIGMAYHLQNQCPGLSYNILEARKAMGGTWDLFRYPGIRSDSDMYTLGFPFRPWKDSKAIADGPAILRYINETAKEFAIDKKIVYDTKVLAANWNSQQSRWQLETTSGNYECKYLIMCSGYYDYDKGYTPEYKNLDRFQGEFVHPQKWPEALDYTYKKIVIIGSGATAVTLVPELAKQAKHVTMLQRSPSYIASLPAVDKVAEFLKKLFPAQMSHHLIRGKNILISMLFFQFCRAFPNAATKLLKKGVKNSLRGVDDWEKHFTPHYTPWDQRLCFVPDGDLFKAIKQKKASVVTDHIEEFTPNGLRLKSGDKLEADIIVSATGLNIKFLGGMSISIDGQPIDPKAVVPYKSSMFSGIPNMGMVFGYTNASWTLKCNLTSEWLAKTIKFMEDKHYAKVTPLAHPQIERRPLIDFSSGYFQRAADFLPKQGKKIPWKVNQNYFVDLYTFRVRPLNDEGLTFQ